MDPPLPTFLKTGKDYKNAWVDTRFGQQVSSVVPGKKQVMIGDEKISYDKLIFATGSRAFIPPLHGVNLPGNFVLKSVKDLDRIVVHKPDRVVVVGSGNIGVEVAEALEIQGCRVTLIELLDRIMPRVFDKKPSLMLRNLLEAHHISVLTSEKVLEVDGGKRVEAVFTDHRSIPCDTVIWAIGVRQNVELANKADIEIGKFGGIKINARLETNRPDIYACGDCIEAIDFLTGQPTLSLLWPSAKRQGEVAALNCLGIPAEYEGAFDVVVEEIYDTTFVSIGFIVEMLKDQNFQLIEQESGQAYYGLVVVDDRVIGMQAVGICDGIGEIMALIKNRIPLSEVNRVIENRALIEKVPWYLEAGKRLFPA